MGKNPQPVLFHSSEKGIFSHSAQARGTVTTTNGESKQLRAVVLTFIAKIFFHLFNIPGLWTLSGVLLSL